jgi:succinyl-diaminopimelate desuccinylase
VAYPRQTINAVHQAAKIIQHIENYNWDKGSEDFPGTCFQVTGVDSGLCVDNLVPGQCKVNFNVRYSHQYSENTLKSLIVSLAEDCLGQDNFKIAWSRPCTAYFSEPRQDSNCLIRLCEYAIHSATGQYPVMSTAGGTSDGRFFANDYTQVVELGVPNHSIHQVNEHVHLSDLATLEDVYADIVKAWIN